MDAPLKERLTGALIVVAVLVIVVPEMLSGPGGTSAPADAAGDSGPPVRTYSLELGSSTTPLSQDQSSLTPQSSEPAAVPVETPVASPDSPIAASRPEPAAEPATAADVKPSRVAEPPAAAPAKGLWWSQLGSFSSRDNAERLAQTLRGKGYSISVARIKVGGKDLYRVRAGPEASREAAVALQSRLAAAGHKSSLVAP